MAKVKVIKALLKGIGSLFKEKGEAVPKLFKTPTKDPELPVRSFFTNLINDFGETEVKEATRITTNAWKKNTFFPGGPQGASFEDDLVNLLETRYMSSDRLQAHPLSFNRRGPGAADRYKMPKMGEEVNPNIRRTDLPGGPGDPDIYKNRWGEMSDNTNMRTGERIYSGKASILDEYADDTIKKIKNNENVSPEDINLAYDNKMMARLKKSVDEQLAPMKLQTKQMNAAARQIDDMTARMEEFARKGDMESARKIEKAIEDYRLKVQADRGTILDEFPILTDPTRKPHAAGGRVGMWGGGILTKFLNKFGRQAPGMKQFHPQGINPTLKHDAEQIKNIIRNPKTDLERRVETPKDHPTIRDVEDFVQNNKNYTGWEKKAMFYLIRKEKLRVEVADAKGIDPADVPDDMLEFMLKNDPTAGDFAQGGRVGYAEGKIVAPTGYLSPSEIKTSAGYLSPYAMMTDAGYEATPEEQAEELKRRLGEASPVYEMLFDALERETAASGGRIGLRSGGGNRDFAGTTDKRAMLPEGGMSPKLGWQPYMTQRAVDRVTPSGAEVAGNSVLQQARNNALNQAKSNFLNTGWAPKPLWLNQGGQIGVGSLFRSK